jgi:periplasmic divalent cation tolerance protein
MNTEAQNYLVVLVTCPPDRAEPLAQTLLREKLVACVNILPTMTSVYCWKNELCRDEEVLLLIKTRQNLFETLRERIVEIHPYEVPEVIALPILAGHLPYLKWISEVTQD